VPTRGAAVLGQELLVNELFKNWYFADEWNYDLGRLPSTGQQLSKPFDDKGP
jgi:hypothetical protein